MQALGDSSHELNKFDSLSSRLGGASNGSSSTQSGSSSNRVDGSVAPWAPTLGLPTVAEHPSGSLGSTISVAHQSSDSVALPHPPGSTEQLTTTAALVEEVDRWLYWAKANGRNRITFHEDLVRDGLVKTVAPEEGGIDLF